MKKPEMRVPDISDEDIPNVEPIEKEEEQKRPKSHLDKFLARCVKSHPMRVASAVAALVWTIAFWLRTSKWSRYSWNYYDNTNFIEDLEKWLLFMLPCCVVYFMADMVKRARKRRGHDE